MLRRAWDKVWGVILGQLKQGLAPSPAAWACALGLYAAVFPILGAVSLLCFLLALLLRLNQPIILTVSWLAYPLQFVCLLPFYALGARVFGGPAMSLDLGQILERVRTDPWAFMQDFWWVGMHGIAVWALIGVFVVPMLWFIFRAMLVRVAAVSA